MKFYAFAFFCCATLTAAAFAQTTSPYYKKITNLQQQIGWSGYALLAPSWGICTKCSPNGTNINWKRTPGITSLTVSGGSSARHDIGGTVKFGDVLWNNHIVGDFSSQGIHDTNHT